MGYDANIKSGRAERRQRYLLLVSLLALGAICFVLVGVLGQADNPTLAVNEARLAAAKALAKHRELTKAAGGARGAGAGVNEGSIRKHYEPSDAVEEARAKQKLETDVRVRDANHAAEDILSWANQKRQGLEESVRAIKKTGVIMEADEHALEMTKKLQEATREVLKLRYGDAGEGHYRVVMDLEFQSSIPDFDEKGKDGKLVVEMAPIDLVPCSVYNFMEIARTWIDGGFHRNAGHVLQVQVHSGVKESMPFQEYHKDFQHQKGTLGYAGRPSGPAFYVSIQDNSKNHGPGSQQKKNPYEADSIIGRVIEGGMEEVVPRIHKMPGAKGMGFIGDKKNWVLIKQMHILVPGDGPGSVDGYFEFSKSPIMIER